LAAKPSPKESQQPLSFEQALARLEDVVHQLEEGQIGLAESLAQYEEGVKLLKQCYQLLEHAERRIDLLSGIGAGGTAITEPFDDRALSLEEKAQARSQRRSASRAAKPESPCDEPNNEPNTGENDMDVPGGLF
jgi:exodeoxyribonuclease VII small subunit